jgi:hypothetical protein
MKMRKLLLLAVAAGAPWSAAAQAVTGSAAAVFEAGRCMVQRDRRAAIALFRALPFDNSRAELSPVGAGAARNCADGASGASALMVRGAIAQALFQRDFRGAMGHEPRPGQDPVDLGLPDVAGPRAAGAPESYRWADCVVRNEPDATARLLRTDVGSPQESAAISGLQLYMAACMAQGAQISVRQSEMRSLFAQGAYHNSYRYWTGQLRDAR